MKSITKIGLALLCTSILIFAVVIVFPYIVALRHATVVASYQDTAGILQEQEKQKMIQECRQFHIERRNDGDLQPLSSHQLKTYHTLLNMQGNGIMACIEIPSIDVSLPIYHGDDDSTLRKGAGHCRWSDLPTGEIGTHSVITAHNGMAEAKMFSDLPGMKPGDIFSITVLDQKMDYRVISTVTIKPDDMRLFTRSSDVALCTLVTCVPFGINSHRFCVTGIRIKPSVCTSIENE